MQVQTQNNTNGDELQPPLTNVRKTSIKKFVKEEVLYLSKSIQLSECTFEDGNGKEKSAEVIRKLYVGRNSCSADTILSIGILKRHILCDCLVLMKQYRPTLKSYVLEFPARIIEHMELERSGDYAMEDLKDNTGYGSTVVKHVSPETAMDPELCDSKLKLVSMIIDGDDPIKNDIKTGPRRKRFNSANETVNRVEESPNGPDGTENADEDEDEFEVIAVPVNGLLDRLSEYDRKGVVVDSRVYAYAMGLKQCEKNSQNASNPENIEVAI